MTDTKELARSIIEAAEKATPGEWGATSSHDDKTFKIYSGADPVTGERAVLAVLPYDKRTYSGLQSVSYGEALNNSRFLCQSKPENVLTLARSYVELCEEVEGRAAVIRKAVDHLNSPIVIGLSDLEKISPHFAQQIREHETQAVDIAAELCEQSSLAAGPREHAEAMLELLRRWSLKHRGDQCVAVYQSEVGGVVFLNEPSLSDHMAEFAAEFAQDVHALLDSIVPDSSQEG